MPDGGADPPPAGARDRAIAIARELLHGCGALRVSIALDAQPPAIVECTRLGPVVVFEEGAEPATLPHDAAGDVELPQLPFMHQVAPFEVDADSGRVAGVLGGLEMLGRAVRDVAALLPGASVVAAEFETTDPDAAARPRRPPRRAGRRAGRRARVRARLLSLS